MTTTKEWAAKKQQEARKSFHFWAAGIADSFTLALCNVMAKKGISRSDLAHSSGVSKAYISKVLNGNTNFTVESMAKLALALGYKVEDIQLSKIDANQAAFRFFKPNKTILFGEIDCDNPTNQDNQLDQYDIANSA